MAVNALIAIIMCLLLLILIVVVAFCGELRAYIKYRRISKQCIKVHNEYTKKTSKNYCNFKVD
jgi:hypothetical protein